jgi:catechol 2,3-dioxygenase-like lactoylglutathione lyase family enzyme
MQIEHIAFQVPDSVATADWYCKNLGFTIKRKVDNAAKVHFLADSNGRLIEVYTNPLASIPDYPSMPPLHTHVAFAVSDMQENIDHLVKAGAKLVEDITTVPPGDQLAMLRDPWGFPLQLVKRVQAMI